ncbi:probable E3 ubiquitin-protein ligase HERC2 isoform X1 [Culex pipiens pallens]|uniref:probable E3 ubiquitin-protein ligase HERC2 isoform X1 n=1 Tax=Culex pipiens pallens TaxID=42434 RepID=UPI0019530737|nr:probable E3 ubiquitin-protein ligase HERC2 isoform X1 [Culex pipiens pallens]
MSFGTSGSGADLHFRALPFLDKKWIKADVSAALRSPEDLANLWNHLVQDEEVVTARLQTSVNAAGDVAYARPDGKYYCGVQSLSCSCCKGVCSASASCSCSACQILEAEEGPAKKTPPGGQLQTSQNQNQCETPGGCSGTILDSWLWSPIPTIDEKRICSRKLIAEQREICLQAAANCLSATRTKQLLYVYRRYFVALQRCKPDEKAIATAGDEKAASEQMVASEMAVDPAKLSKNSSFDRDPRASATTTTTPLKDCDKATFGLARVGTRAALNFSFAFLRRAWRSGEDVELCSELLSEALEALQTLPEASLFDTSQMSSLWIEVVEKSIKFLRQVVLGDVMGGRCLVPKADRHIALNLLLELGAQKGTLGGSLEGISLLLTLHEKDQEEQDDNRSPPFGSSGAPLVPLLKRYEQIDSFAASATDSFHFGPTESFLRFLTLPESETATVDLKQAAVIIISHLDRLAKPHLPAGNYSAKVNAKTNSAQKIFTLGWSSCSPEMYGFTSEASNASAQLLAGSVPRYSTATIELPPSLQVRQVACTENSIYIVTTSGQLYSIHSSCAETVAPKLVEGLEGVSVIQIAAHCEGRHAMALSSAGEVYSWGAGEGGRLGHGDTASKEVPTKIVLEKQVTAIYAGASYSAAVSSVGELFTWGRGTYGRLGHGNSDDKFVPTQVQALKAYKVVDVALGSGDAHSMAVTDGGLLFAWGDGDFGKLGNGSCNGSPLPVQIEGVSSVARIYSGSQFSVALSYDGTLYSWGKGHGGRLGHGNSEHSNVPKLVHALEGKKIVDVAVGSAHCLALTSSGELYGWGRNDYQQICPSGVSRDPIITTPLLTTPPTLRISGMTCGAAQSIVWCASSTLGVASKIPFVVDLSEHTFRQLDQLLCMVCPGTGPGDIRHPPSQEAECIAVASLNLLRLQLHAMIVNNVPARAVGLVEGSRLLASLKSRILTLAGGPVVLKTMQEAAQWTLQVGWSILLPTASERAQTLTSLLPVGHDAAANATSSNSSSGHRFMTDLLVGSLMAEGGLQTALNQAINAQRSQDCGSGSGSTHLSLLHLLKQLLRNNSSLTQARLGQLMLGPYLKTEEAFSSPEPPSPSLDLLHKFQRLLLSYIYQSKTDLDLSGAEALLDTYIQQVVTACVTTLNKAHETILQGKEGVAEILESDISDALLYELLIGLVLIQKEKSLFLSSFDWNKHFIPLLHSLDNFNRLTHEGEVHDSDDMGWPGIICRGTAKSPPVQEETLLIRRSDIENHCADGGNWVIINGNVYDVADYQPESPATQEILQPTRDISLEISNPQHRTAFEFITSFLRVGRFAINEICDKDNAPRQLTTLTHFHSECMLAYLLGLRSNILQSASPLQPAELQCKNLLNSTILSGGLQVLQPSNPFDEEKGEARSSGSTAGSTPTDASSQIPIADVPQMANWPSVLISHRVESMLAQLGEGKLTDPLVASWIAICERFCKENHLIWHQEFPPEHPVMELERLLMAVLIRHQNLGPLALAVVDRELSGNCSKPPPPIVTIIKQVHQTKWSIVKMRQQLNRSYKEVCAPMIDKCRFLLYEIRPAISLEQHGLGNLHILHKLPRFKALVRRIITEMRAAKKQLLTCAKPEDILNVTIQSQFTSSVTKIQSQENLSCKNQSTENLVNESLIKVASLESLNAGGRDRSASPVILAAVQKVNTASDENLLNVGCVNEVGVGGGDGDGGGDKKIPITSDEIKTPTNELIDYNNSKMKNPDGGDEFINNVIASLSEKCLIESYPAEFKNGVSQQIVDFILYDLCDVETLRRALYCQIQRYQIRKQGLEMLYELLKIPGLFDAAQYNLFNGYLGLHASKSDTTQNSEHILENLNMITAFQKADILIAQSKIIEWTVAELQKYVNQEKINGRHRNHGEKDNSNLGTYVFLKKLPRARFLLSIFGILSRTYEANELSLLINSGILGTIMGLLRQTGADLPNTKNNTDISVIYEDVVTNLKSSKEGLPGPELAKLMKIGTRIARGADWKWGEQDGPGGEGRIISEIGEDGWVRVEWDNGSTNSYRMGKEGQYDLRLADSALKALSPDKDSEKEDFIDQHLYNESHPTKLLRNVCIKTLQMLFASVGMHAEKMQQNSLRSVASMFRAILTNRITYYNFALEQWTTLGFLRAISSSKALSMHLTSPVWIELAFEILNSPITCKKDVYKKLHCLRLLQSTLVNWTGEESHRVDDIIVKLFDVLGKISLYCPNDLSLLNNAVDIKSRVLYSASHTGTIAEEIIVLIRKLHTLPLWNENINSFIAQKLCLVADVFLVSELEINFEGEKASIMGALCTIGGCDSRPRLGLNLTLDGVRGTISRMTKKGKVVMNVHAQAETKKIPIFKVSECADVGAFSLSKLTINEMLLNSWAVLFYGIGQTPMNVANSINMGLLQTQQINFSALKATKVLFRHQSLLRKILRQRSPGITRSSSKDSLSDRDGSPEEGKPRSESNTSEESQAYTELLIQTILLRATQPSPLKACYSFQEMELAALNISQMLASHVHNELNAPSNKRAFPVSQATMIHGVPIYNNESALEDAQTPSGAEAAISGASTGRGTARRSPPSALVAQIMEMGFTRKSVETAIKSLTLHTNIKPTAEQVVQWILEHPDVTANLGGKGDDNDAHSDTESVSSDTMDGGSSLHDSQQVVYKSRDDFKSADQYAIYVRGLICPGMLVRCCQDFEEIRKGDIGTVLKVEPEGLHDLNVRVDWQMRDRPYWMCFVHLELLEAPPSENSATIGVGSQIRIRNTQHFRYRLNTIPRGSIGTVTSVNGTEVTAEFPQQTVWNGHLNELELISNPLSFGGSGQGVFDIIDDWSRCIRSLTVSSNESSAKYLLDRSTNYWQSSSTQGKHWIRLEIHDQVFIQTLSINVDPDDYSHMPSLVVIRGGDSVATLKELHWVSINPTDVVVQLLNDCKQYYAWIEILVKQCRNNGIQCKIHGLNIIGKRKQTDLEMMLQNASFLATENDSAAEPSYSTSSNYADEQSSNEISSKVLVWGLNDKEQLGGLKGSKVKLPTYSSVLSQLKPIHISGGSKSLFIVSQDGKLYACGEGTNGRLGLGHNNNVPTPRQVPILNQYVVKKVAVHSGGKHAMALTLDGKVFSWGEGEDGKLGHGNRVTLEKPKLLESLRTKRIRDIACGSSHSAAITSSGELYTWGLGEYGRLGHGDNCTQLKPKLVTALQGHRVVQVACGSRDAQTLCLTEEGLVFSWGDGDFGKLGRGGSEGCSVPHQVERLNGVGVVQIECGAQFSLALTKIGEVWTWGKGDYYRLGHGTDQHVRKPTPIQGLRGKKVIHVAVGALHCLAVTDSGQVFAWGDNDHGQQGSGNTVVNKKPNLVLGLDGVFVNRVACGSSHSVAWSLPQNPSEKDKKEPVPFAVSKDPLGSHSLGIYALDSEPTTSQPQLGATSAKQQRPSLSESVLSLETYGARQAALSHILNSMSILHARSCIIASLTCHSQLTVQDKAGFNETRPITPVSDNDHDEPKADAEVVQQQQNEVIAHGGGEGPADVSGLIQTNDIADCDIPIVSGMNNTLSAYRSLTGSLSLSASISSCNATQRHSKMSASAMSVMAATMTHHDEMMHDHPVNSGLDDFTALLGESEAKHLIELLKLSVSGRTGPANTAETIANTLIALAKGSTTISNMLIETCITELEDLCTSRHSLGKPKPVVQETSHPYIDDITLVGHVKIPGAEALRIEFDSQCSTERRNDPLIIIDGAGRVVATRSGREWAQWAPEIRIAGDEMRWKFTSDNSVNGWGWRFFVHAIMPESYLQELGSDRTVLSQPSIAMVMALLDSTLAPTSGTTLTRLTAALSQCAQLSSLTVSQRIWSLKKMHQYLTTKDAPKMPETAMTEILSPLIPIILRQYEYEEPQVRSGLHLMHSEYFKTLVALASDMQLDSMLPNGDAHKWAWFRRYCSAVRVAQSLIRRVALPATFTLEVRKKLIEIASPATNPALPPSANSLTSSNCSLIQHTSSGSNLSQFELGVVTEIESIDTSKYVHEDHSFFTPQYDSQLLQWFNRRPEDWAFSWGGASTIFGWGHNHRGQLGGLDGSRIKMPTPCEALSLLRPIQIAGGEQTLYAVTPDGKLYATGYGAGGRLGIGGTDSVSTPTLVESLQHVIIKKVAVNSGGKHCLALSSDGEVFSWGEGEDGKLGHGNRDSYDRPKLIEALSGIGVVDIACGSAHSACITSQGHVLTWGKGRYGRLGHGDSEDQLQPKLVEALLGYRAIDIACGSGDAQTLCITDDDNVWSWGDGDYGKLGRGGSDGCKIPMKIESLAGLGVIKVECGSQFSVALTRSGSVYTWGKGDYHRLGHGNTDHVRRPKKVAALQGKKIISIATGSLHCVACSDSGEVFTWGDNDEGQLGDGTVTAIQRPRLVQSLQGKHIVKVICGSAHTLALSTYQLSEAVRPPPSPPLEYDLVRDIAPEVLHARLVLLHHFSELICPGLAMLPISGELSLGALKDILVYSIKEAGFRKVIQTTMVRDKPHGPVIELNRIQVKRSRMRSGNGLAGVDGMKSVFGQMVQKLPLLTQEALSMPHRVWKVKFVGESVDDCGGGFSESIAEMCDELQNGSIPLLIQTPNGRGEAGANRDCFLLDPTLSSVLHMNMFRFLGVLMGIAVRTGSPLSLNLAEPVWRQLCGETLRPSDLTEVDRDYITGLLYIRDIEDDPKVFASMELPFSTPSAKGHEVPLSTRFTKITPENRNEYVKLALNYRIHEFDEQLKAVRDGMSKVIPVPLLSLFSAAELQAMVCGSPDIPLCLLKTVATYKGVESTAPLVQWFWEVMEEFTNQERSLFLRFVWGRTRLPRTIADFRGRDFVLQVLDKYNPPDHFLPESYTCFFLLKMPRYSCKAVLQEKLKYAIYFCKSIDTDEYARVAMGDPTEATGSEDNSDIESIA